MKKLYQSLLSEKTRAKISILRRYVKHLLLYGEPYPREFLIFDDKKLVFLVLAKNACTSIKITLGKTYGIRTDHIHDWANWKIRLARLKKHEKQYFKFAFVRNPYARIVSCYRNKVLLKEEQLSSIDGYPFYCIKANISFEKFVKKIVRIPDFLADIHFKSQYSVLYQRGQLLTDYLGKVENIEQDWKKLAQWYGLEANLVHSNNSTEKESVYRDYKLYYTQELAELVYQRYRQDFELLGYQTARQELLDFIN